MLKNIFILIHSPWSNVLDKFFTIPVSLSAQTQVSKSKPVQTSPVKHLQGNDTYTLSSIFIHSLPKTLLKFLA